MPFYAAPFVLGIIGMAVVIPSLPGHIGTFHYAGMMALTVFGVDKNVGLIYATILHGIGYISVVSAGLIFMSRYGLKLREIQRLPGK